MKILFVNACVRGAESNTLKLCRGAVEALQQQNPEATVTEVDLNKERPAPLYPEDLLLRSELRGAGDFSHSLFAYAKEFAAADMIVIGAPYWDLNFPAVLKIYLERICAGDVTFSYAAGGPQGLCQAKGLLFVTSSGWPIAHHLGFEEIKALCQDFFGIEDVRYFALEGLEMGIDVAEAVAQGQADIQALIAGWQ